MVGVLDSHQRAWAFNAAGAVVRHEQSPGSVMIEAYKIVTPIVETNGFEPCWEDF